ncbi:MAG: serpin family protein [Prevotella sp.]|nr:serpin family protein [Prevotella sp.]
MTKQEFMKGLAVILMMAACTTEKNSDDPKPVVCPVAGIELTRGEKDLVLSNNDFAFNLLRQATVIDEAGSGQERTLMLSPFSITTVLSMLSNGAAGLTQQQINQVLGFTDVSQANVFCQKLMQQAPRLDEKTRIAIANNIYVNKGIQLKPAFLQTAQSYYMAQPTTLDFRDAKTMDIINQWAKDKTEGMISEVVNEKSFEPDAISYMLNATYFKGEWARKFNADMTREEPFYSELDNKTVRQVPMMQQEGTFSYTQSDDYQLLQMPFGNGLYAMTFILPREGNTLNGVKWSISGSWWQELPKQMMSRKVQVRIPRFEISTNIDLVQLMSDLGMPLAFTEAAEFPDLCQQPAFIGKMNQCARIKVNEQGAEAAAVTTVTGMPTSVMGTAFVANRPFLYVISEQSTGTILFIGQYTGIEKK